MRLRRYRYKPPAEPTPGDSANDLTTASANGEEPPANANSDNSIAIATVNPATSSKSAPQAEADTEADADAGVRIEDENPGANEESNVAQDAPSANGESAETVVAKIDAVDVAPDAKPILPEQNVSNDDADVTQIQELLRRLGYLVDDTAGELGDSTRRAIRAFKRDNSLLISDVLDAKFVKSLVARADAEL